MCAVSPGGGFEFEEFLGGLDDPGVVAGQDAGPQEEAHIPVALQLVQAAFLTQQAAQLHSCTETSHRTLLGKHRVAWGCLPLGYGLQMLG